VNSLLERLRWAARVQAVAASGNICLLIQCPKPTLSSKVTFTQPGNEPSAEILTVSPEYFGTMGDSPACGKSHYYAGRSGASHRLGN
jgi:hypothetical protein